MRTRAARGVCCLALMLLAASATAREPVRRMPPEAAQAMVARLLVPSPYRMSAEALSGEVRYRLRFETPRDWDWPQTGEQMVAIQGDAIHLRICAGCGTEPAPDAATLARALAANHTVNSDNAQVRAFARRHARGGDVHARMRRLTQAVRAHMTGPVIAHEYLDAAEALRTRRGDCTEYAVLLAAAARARGIPARLVYGLAYSSRFTGHAHVFSPHMWVQVWDGARWTSYDAGFQRFDAGHIALHVDDGSAAWIDSLQQAMTDLVIEDAFGVVPADAPASARGRRSESTSETTSGRTGTSD